MEQKQKEQTLKKHLNGLYRTDKELGVLTSLCEQARWFVRERREERYVKLLQGEFARVKRQESKTLLRTLLLVDRLIRQYKSFRQHIAPVIAQIFVELFSIFYQPNSYAEILQMKKMRKKWVTLLPDETLRKIKTIIQKQYSFNVDSGFSEGIIQQIKDYYTNQLKLTPEQCQKYLPKIKVQPSGTRKSVEKEPSSESEEKEVRPVKRTYEQHVKPNIKPSSQPPTYAKPINQAMMPPSVNHYQQQRYMPPPGYTEQPVATYASQRYPMNYYPPPNMGMVNPNPNMPAIPNQYMQYAAQNMAYGYYPTGQYPPQPQMDQYYAQHQPQQHIPNTYQPEYPYQKPYEPQRPISHPSADYEEGRRERPLQQKPQQPNRSPPSFYQQSAATNTLNNNVKHSKPVAVEATLSVREKLQELRLGCLRCPRCGLQSANRESFDLHLKSHFQQSRRAYDVVRKSNPIERVHLPNTQQWLSQTIKPEEQEYFVEMALATDVIMYIMKTVCKLCSSPLKPSWDTKLEKWVYRNAVTVRMNDINDGTFHYDCYRAIQEEQQPQAE